MKKYFMGIVAVVLAISLSAFSSISTTKEEKSLTTLYWYYFNSSNGSLNGEISSTPITHSAAKDATQCPDTQASTIDCARGYASPQNPVDPSPGAGADQVKRPAP